MPPDQHAVLLRGLADHAGAQRLPWPPAVRAILWLDAVLLVAAALALGGMPPALSNVSSPWTWIALAGSTLTAVSAALSAFEATQAEYNPAWNWLPLPAFGLWMAASGIGCFALPDGALAWGGSLGEAAQCL